MEMHYHHNICMLTHHYCLMLIPGNHKDLLCFYIIMWAIFSPVIKGGLFYAPDPLACYLEEENFYCDNFCMFMMHMSSKWAWQSRISLSWCSIWFLCYLLSPSMHQLFIVSLAALWKNTIYSTPLQWKIEVYMTRRIYINLKKWILLDQNGRFLSFSMKRQVVPATMSKALPKHSK